MKITDKELREIAETGAAIEGCGRHALATELLTLRARVAELEAEKLRDARALALVDIALRGPDGVKQVRKMTGGNAPELVQGLLDGVTVLTARATGLDERVADDGRPDPDPTF